MRKNFSRSYFLIRAAVILTAFFTLLPIYSFSSSAIDIKPTKAQSISVSAKSAVLIETDSGKIIWQKNAGEKMPMASTTKIMTALVAIENYDVSASVEISPEAVGIEGSSVYLYEGERLTMEELLYAMLLESANDAATAIAIEVGGSVEEFADMMNQKARELGLKSTHFTNPHGLDDEEHYTTAEELAKITRAALSNDTFRQIVSTYKKTIPLNETEGVRLLINHNKLLKSYDGAIGVKTGYTKKSGRCLVSAAERDGVSLICVTLNAPDDWNDHKKLFDYGFSRYESRSLCNIGDTFVHPVICGVEEYVVLSPISNVSVTVPRDSGEIICTTELFPFSYAPVEKGEEIGRLIYTLNGEKIAEVPLCASYSVEKQPIKKNLWEKFLELLGF